MARAGFSFDVATKVIDAHRDEADQIIML